MAEIPARTVLCCGSVPSLPDLTIDFVPHGGQILLVVSHLALGWCHGRNVYRRSASSLFAFVSQKTISVPSQAHHRSFLLNHGGQFAVDHRWKRVVEYHRHWCWATVMGSEKNCQKPTRLTHPLSCFTSICSQSWALSQSPSCSNCQTRDILCVRIRAVSCPLSNSLIYGSWVAIPIPVVTMNTWPKSPTSPERP